MIKIGKIEIMKDKGMYLPGEIQTKFFYKISLNHLSTKYKAVKTTFTLLKLAYT